MTDSLPTSKPRRKRGLRYVLNLLIAAVIVLFLTIEGFGAYQGYVSAESFFYPERIALCCTPAQNGLAYEDVEFQTSDGLTLRGWYLPSQNGVAVIVAHGIHQTRENTFKIAELLNKHGYGVLTFDIRGHGESDGESVVDMYKDGVGAVDYLDSRDDVQHIGIFGFSLGGVLAIHTAALNDKIEAIVTDGAGFTEYEDMPAPSTPLEWLYVGYDFAFFNIGKPRFGSYAPTSTLKAVSKIAPRPQMYIASDTEQRMVERFYQAASEPKDFWYIQGVNHGEGAHLHKAEYEQKLIAFYGAAFAK